MSVTVRVLVGRACGDAFVWRERDKRREIGRQKVVGAGGKAKMKAVV